MVYGVGQDFFDCRVGVVVYPLRFGFIFIFDDDAFYSIVLYERKCIPQLPLNWTGERSLGHFCSGRIRKVDYLNARIPKVFFGSFGKHEYADVKRLDTLDGSGNQVHVFCDFKRCHINRLFIQVASRLFQISAHQSDVKIIYFCKQIRTVIKGNIG